MKRARVPDPSVAVRLDALAPGELFKTIHSEGFVLGPGPHGGVRVELKVRSGAGKPVEDEWIGSVKVERLLKEGS